MSDLNKNLFSLISLKIGPFSSFFLHKNHILEFMIAVYPKKFIKCSLFSTLRKPSVNRKELWALTLVGTPWDNLELDPLAVLHLDNQLYV